MRRFFRSAAFPILIVIVLAFFAQRLISPGPKEETPNFGEFQSQIEEKPDSIESVTFEQKTQTLKVTEAETDGGGEYSVGYPTELEDSLVNSLRREGIEYDVEGTGGSSFLSLLTYILPFLLFFGFWIFLMNQMQG